MDLEMEDADVNAVLGLGDFDPEYEPLEDSRLYSFARFEMALI